MSRDITQEIAAAVGAVATIVTPTQQTRGLVIGIVEGFVFLRNLEGDWEMKVDDVTEVTDVQRPNSN